MMSFKKETKEWLKNGMVPPEPYMFFFDHNNTNFYYVAGL